MARRLGIGIRTLDRIESGTFPSRCGIQLFFNVQRAFRIPPAKLLSTRLERCDPTR